MFKFDFDIDDADNAEELLGINLESLSIQDPSTKTEQLLELEPFSELTLTTLLDGVPDQISYSPLFISLSSTRKSTCLLRRDLFDARFQLISEGAGDVVDEPAINQQDENNASDLKTARKALEFLSAPSDLVPGVYEGGLKTWECSLDLVDYLDSLKETSKYESFVGKKILEVGCGTGVPTMYIFRELLYSSKPGDTPLQKTVLQLQDYNASVLQLVTLPNILLTWYTSTHADAYRTSIKDDDMAPIIQDAASGELPITPEFKTAFLKTLQDLNITLRFFAGSWDTFNPTTTSTDESPKYDILLTSETIYRNESLQPLINLMRRACPDQSVNKTYLCLVAAKVLYFGVGGGVSDFLQAVEKEKAAVETVLERKSGVGRKILRLRW
ncbi:Histidine protein methyltransferase 1 [Psilocybe cubensis]|uniref:protein-histidine N-methyltransferase n=2 Tax=Psilocybe cubensis TaxID=181762 RepID=A0A8H7XQ68_PSICU|nr:Histidine protein methyltransferase 1 [Psilocybe cubensis]KAH9477610.1 Histidine protein methyltransferase 1 [Psilocybe cubensis]